MFSVRQKRDISETVQRILRATNHPKLPNGEIRFLLHVEGAEPWSWADIRNNGAVENPTANPWNEEQEGNPQVVHHIDGNPFNNKPRNLRIMPLKENKR